uniref:Uncharacterized protein n=1 Tax=Opuntia streptacantha TaxID=393608 RepID=A0A7C8YEG8_OPUST
MSRTTISFKVPSFTLYIANFLPYLNSTPSCWPSKLERLISPDLGASIVNLVQDSWTPYSFIIQPYFSLSLNMHRHPPSIVKRKSTILSPSIEQGGGTSQNFSAAKSKATMTSLDSVRLVADQWICPSTKTPLSNISPTERGDGELSTLFQEPLFRE